MATEAGPATTPGEPATARLWLRVGATLVPEPWSPGDVAQAQPSPDGGLELCYADHVLAREDVWDRLPGLVAAWRQGLDALAAGAPEAIVVFPDTRVEAQLRRHSDELAVRYEDIDVRVPLHPIVRAVRAAAQRLDAVWPTGANQHRAADAAPTTSPPGA